MPAALGERGTKRIASYVPKWCRDELHKLSKADLMEIAFDYAMRSVGEDAGEVAAYDELRNTAHILARCADRSEPRIQRGKELAEEYAERCRRREARRAEG
jgi:hypothetical protein